MLPSQGGVYCDYRIIPDIRKMLSARDPGDVSAAVPNDTNSLKSLQM